MKKFVLLILGALLLLASCGIMKRVGYPADIERYIGRPYYDIIYAFGEPDREYDEADGFVMVYYGAPTIFTYDYTYKREYGVPTAKFLIGRDDLCHDVTFYNTEPVWEPMPGRTFLLIVLLLMML